MTTLTTCFPVTGAQAVQSPDASAYDGRWLLLDASGEPLPSDEPTLQHVEVALRFGYLVLKAPGMLRLDVPLDIIEDDPSVMQDVVLDGVKQTVADEGPWAAEWFSQVAGRPVRLVKRV